MSYNENRISDQIDDGLQRQKEQFEENMTSENYRQILNIAYQHNDLTMEDFDNTLMHFAMLYHKEQLTLNK